MTPQTWTDNPLENYDPTEGFQATERSLLLAQPSDSRRVDRGDIGVFCGDGEPEPSNARKVDCQNIGVLRSDGDSPREGGHHKPRPHREENPRFLRHHRRISIHSNSSYESIPFFIFCLNSSDTILVAQLLQAFSPLVLSDSGTQNRIIDRSYVGPIFTVLVPIVLQRVKKIVKRPKSNSPCLASSFDYSSSSSSSLILISTTIALCKHSTEHRNRPSSPT